MDLLHSRGVWEKRSSFLRSKVVRHRNQKSKIDVAKRPFQVHGAEASGKVVLRKRLSRSAVAQFLAQLSPTFVATEACSGAHHWGRIRRPRDRAALANGARGLLAEFGVGFPRALHRTHLGLNKDTPLERPVQHRGRITSMSKLGGLHHAYVRI